MNFGVSFGGVTRTGGLILTGGTLIGGLIFVGVSYFVQIAHPSFQFDSVDSAAYEIARNIGGDLFVSIFLIGLIVGQFASGLSAQASGSPPSRSARNAVTGASRSNRPRAESTSIVSSCVNMRAIICAPEVRGRASTAR